MKQFERTFVPETSRAPWVFFFGDGRADGNGKMKDELGGKGAGLAEMTNAGLPVPPGFTIQTSACRRWSFRPDPRLCRQLVFHFAVAVGATVTKEKYPGSPGRLRHKCALKLFHHFIFPSCGAGDKQGSPNRTTWTRRPHFLFIVEAGRQPLAVRCVTSKIKVKGFTTEAQRHGEKQKQNNKWIIGTADGCGLHQRVENTEILSRPSRFFEIRRNHLLKGPSRGHFP